MVLSNATQATIDFFLANLWAWNSKVFPNKFMSDQDPAQMNMIQIQYIESILYLYWWHDHYTWQQHFIMQHFPELQKLFKKWIRLSEKSDFDCSWTEIKKLSPHSFTKYVVMYWMLTRLCGQLSTTKTVPYLGSVTLICWWKHMCTSLHFFLFITNGVHFSWHHILKGKMLDGKQNKQLDHLLYILLHKAILFYKAKHQHQKYGLKGPDLEVQEREKMQVCGATFTLNDIQKVTSGHLYLIYSQSCPKHQHIVDIETYTCD